MRVVAAAGGGGRQEAVAVEVAAMVAGDGKVCVVWCWKIQEH